MESSGENVVKAFKAGKANAKDDSGGIGGFLKDVGKSIVDPLNIISGTAHALGVPTGAQKRAQANLVNEQIKAYRDQTNMTKEMLNNTRNEVAAEKRRVNEKQIRGLRRNYGAKSFLGDQQSSQPDMSSKLGG